MIVKKSLSFSQLKEIYEQEAVRDFPSEELKPLSTLKILMEKNLYEAFGFYDQDKLCAYAFFLCLPKGLAALLDYFAVLPPYRSLGIGSEILFLFKDLYPDLGGILIEVENPRFASSKEEEKVQERRIAFYEKSGALKTDISLSLFQVPFEILYLPISKTLNKSSIQKELMALYGAFIPKESWKKSVELQ